MIVDLKIHILEFLSKLFKITIFGFKKLKNNPVAEPVGPVKNSFLFFTSP